MPTTNNTRVLQMALKDGMEEYFSIYFVLVQFITLVVSSFEELKCDGISAVWKDFIFHSPLLTLNTSTQNNRSIFLLVYCSYPWFYPQTESYSNKARMEDCTSALDFIYHRPLPHYYYQRKTLLNSPSSKSDF